MKRKNSTERKKAALDFLDEEIQQLNKSHKTTGGKKLDSLEQQILAGLSGSMKKTKSKESSNQGQGDLEFNDLEISFEKEH